MKRNIKNILKGVIISGALTAVTVGSVFGYNTYEVRLSHDNKYDYITELKQNRSEWFCVAPKMYWNSSIMVKNADYRQSKLLNNLYVKGASLYIVNGNGERVSNYVSYDSKKKEDVSRSIQTDYVYWKYDMIYSTNWHYFK